jgi:trimeric autotransporter adhesin
MRPLPRTFVLVLAIALGASPFSLGQYSITTIAGGGPTNLPALSASIGYAASVARDASGNTYIADSYSSYIFEVSTSGTLTIVAGNGTIGYYGDGGLATSAALNRPQGVTVDASGNLFIADTGNSAIREVLASSGVIQTVAGGGTPGYGGDGGPAASAGLNEPSAVFVDGSGNIFIADTDNSVIREVTASNGNIQTVAGNGTAGYSGDTGPAIAAQLDEPGGVFVDASGNIFIADTFNSVIREVTAGDISTVVGVSYAWDFTCNYSGDNGPATSAQLCLPTGVFLDGSGDIFIADTNNSVIREVIAGTISTIAGDGTAGYAGDGNSATAAELNSPNAIFVDSSANLYIADTDNSVIREVTAGNISTLIGNSTLAYSGDGSSALNAELNDPGQAFVDASGDVFLSDTNNSAIREVVASSGNIQTVAGNGTSGYSGDSGLAAAAELNFPYGFALDGLGDIFIADTENSVIREVVAATGDIQTIAGTGTAGYSGDGEAATSAELSGPYAVAVDAAGNIFIADTENSAVRVINPSSQPVTIAGITIPPGTIATVAGNGTACTSPTAGCGDDGPATSAELNFPSGISLDASDDIFVADTFNNSVREINASTGIIQTVAGTTGTRGYSGDNGSPTSALLDTPYGLFVDSLGNIFIADTENSAIREVVAVTAIIQTVAGDGTAGFAGDGGPATGAELNRPLGLVEDSAGNLYVADSENSRIRELTSTLNNVIYPNASTLPASGPQQFAAVVTGSQNTSVTWQVNHQTGGSSTWGTISSAGLYQAPSTLPSSGVITVTAISNANGFTSASAQVKLVSSTGAAVVVKSTPSGVTEVYTGTTQAFTAAVTGESNSSVNWQVNKISGGNPTFGTISTSGSYSAPSSVPTPSLILITASSQANPAVSGVYPFLVVTAPSASQPAAQTISPGGVAKYSMSLNANTGDPKQPITLSCVASSLPAGASCTFTPKTITPASTEVPFTLNVAVPSGSAALHNSLRPWLLPQVFAAFLPLAGILVITGKRNRHSRHISLVPLCLLLLLTACGGGSSGSPSSTQTPQNPEAGSYTIQIQATSGAQPNPITITTAPLTVQ